MATYNVYQLQATPSANPATGRTVLMRGDIDFRRMDAEGRSVTASDVLRAIRIKDHWVIKNAWYRVRIASSDSSTRTVDIGTADNGTQIASNVNMKSAGDWVQGTIGSDTAGGTGGHSVYGADGYIFVSPDHAFTTGLLEVMVEVVAMPGAED